MTFPLQGLQAITIFTEDLAASRRFYAEVFGLAALNDDDVSTAFRFGNTIINVLLVSEASELIEPALVAGPAAGARAQLTTAVSDVDATCAALAERGVTLLNGPQDRPWGVRTAAFSDPSGHVWEIAGPLSA